MTRRLIASTVMTESNGGDLQITNKQGYVGRYQAGAGWLADAGYVDRAKLNDAMTDAGFDPQKVRGAEWKWANSGGMTRFLEDSSNWKNGFSLEQYKSSAALQDGAFKINSDKAYSQAIRNGVLDEGDDPAKVAGFLKARHISGYGGAREAVTGGGSSATATAPATMTTCTTSHVIVMEWINTCSRAVRMPCIQIPLLCLSSRSAMHRMTAN